MLWFVVLMHPHRWIASHGLQFFHRTEAILFIPLLAAMAVRAATARRSALLPPYMVYTLFAAGTIPFAANRGLAFETFQILAIYYILSVATLVYVRRPTQAIPILLMFVSQFAWWAVHAGTTGMAQWDPELGNTDGFGGFMVMGLGLSYWVSVGAGPRKLRWFAFGLAAYCLVGTVASFARGAIFSAIAVAFYIWLRSPRKLPAAVAFVSGAIVFLAASAVLFPGGALWQELNSAFTEGTQSGTGGDRWQLWTAAYRVFLARPLIGVGGGGFGAFAADYFGEGEIPGYENPARLWGRSLHSVYFQVLSEFGTVGSLLFIFLILDFVRRNRALGNPVRGALWASSTGGIVDLRYAAYGLESAMLGLLLGGLFYANLYTNWLYTTYAVNALLYTLTSPAIPRAPRNVGNHRGALPGDADG